MKAACVLWTVILTIVCGIHIHGYQDDFEKEMEQLLDEPSNPADALLKTLGSSAEIDEYTSVCVYLFARIYVVYCALTLHIL